MAHPDMPATEYEWICHVVSADNQAQTLYRHRKENRYVLVCKSGEEYITVWLMSAIVTHLFNHQRVPRSV